MQPELLQCLRAKRGCWAVLALRPLPSQVQSADKSISPEGERTNLPGSRQ